MAEQDDRQAPQAATGAEDGRFSIQKIYVKDVSFETPNSPDVFRAEWKPNVDLHLSSDANRLSQDVYEVSLTVTVTVTLGERTAYLAEVNQAGIFGITGVTEERLRPLLGSFCPGILFPYARETVSDLVTRGGFPQFLLAPVNFDVLYAKHLEEQRAKAAGGTAEPDG